MAEKLIEKISKEELRLIANYNQSQFLSDKNTQKNTSQNSKTQSFELHHEYISKLKKHPEEISKWFEPFGYIYHESFDDKIYVMCQDFIALFDDFDLLLEEHGVSDYVFDLLTSEDQESKFDFSKFKETCEAMDLTAAQAMEEYIAIKLSERFPSSYPASRKEYKDKAATKAFKDYEKECKNSKLVDIMREIKNRQTMLAEATHNRGHFGFYRKPE